MERILLATLPLTRIALIVPRSGWLLRLAAVETPPEHEECFAPN